ncbi:cysteine desulfurase family protein [Alteromonas sp. ASW11-130]|uniref:cysteine desulfurase family protein n=1 Tax=Alteromonas sp. ASW11-130 TaxID=3015775 RepID=UPI0022421B04|nr:cysteine desulfurase family protein [Alteromonas sp. ASW11-130]MCW8093458.1 cysteine desulfurase [Alteromonas sp. ASW11-130]
MEQQRLSGYFDYNATTPISTEVVESMIPTIKHFANPSSSNRHAMLSKKIINDTRNQVASLLNTQPSKIFFTSGGSEANNWAVKGVLLNHIANPGHIITSEIEHASVLSTVEYCVAHFGFSVTYLKPDQNGKVNVSDVERALRDDTQLITIMYANNETGVLQPIPDISKLARDKHIPFHVDAVQLVGKRRIDLEALHVDYLSLSAHKFYGPKGVGCLYIKDASRITPLIHGGGQELSMRSGTENLVAIAGLAKAAQDASNQVERWDQNNWSCKQYMMSLLDSSPIQIKYNGSTAYNDALSNTLNISIAGIRGEALAARMEIMHSYIISIGSACSNNKAKNISHVLEAMTLSDDDIVSSVRISFGRFTSRDDVKRFVTTLVAEVQALIAISGR